MVDFRFGLFIFLVCLGNRSNELVYKQTGQYILTRLYKFEVDFLKVSCNRAISRISKLPKNWKLRPKMPQSNVTLKTDYLSSGIVYPGYIIFEGGESKCDTGPHSYDFENLNVESSSLFLTRRSYQQYITIHVLLLLQVRYKLHFKN